MFVKIISFVLIGIVVFGVAGCVFGLAYSMHPYDNGKVILLNNRWESDDYTYSNFTISVRNMNLSQTVKCNYFHIGSTMQFSENDLYFFWFDVSKAEGFAVLPEGC